MTTTRSARAPEQSVSRPPRRTDGELYRYELIHPDDRRRTYADEPTDLVAELLPGYRDVTEPDRLGARTTLAVQAQVITQALLLADHGTDSCDPAEVAVLEGDRQTPPTVDTWSAPLPLILVEGFYRPDGPLPRPTGDIVWIDPRTDEALLLSLHGIGWITLARRRAPDGGG